MRVRIHRGASEIGGNCVELEIDAKRLVLDLGRPLDAECDSDLPNVAGLSAPDDGSLLGVILSHPHQDHYGLVALADPSVPIYVGEAAAAILEAASFFTPSGLRLRPAGFLEDRRPFALGPYTVTPFLVDHSAFDSYALLVEGAGRRLFYTGDFRAHGRKASLVRQLCDRPPKDIDVVLLEGTHVRGEGEGINGPSERDVELSMAETFRTANGLGVVFSSTQNLDRLVTIYRACKRSRRTLVVDLYAAATAIATAHRTIPSRAIPIFVSTCRIDSGSSSRCPGSSNASTRSEGTGYFLLRFASALPRWSWLSKARHFPSSPGQTVSRVRWRSGRYGPAISTDRREGEPLVS